MDKFQQDAERDLALRELSKYVQGEHLDDDYIRRQLRRVSKRDLLETAAILYARK